MDVNKILQAAESVKKSNKKVVQKLSKLKSAELDDWVEAEHEQVFGEVNCLTCANCCKTLGPRILKSDIHRIARSLKMKVSDFMDRYIRVDEDSDFVFNRLPCPFLQDDNKCAIYEVRPRACRGYPHTDERNFRSKLSLALKNTETCPAVCKIFDRMRAKIH